MIFIKEKEINRERKKNKPLKSTVIQKQAEKKEREREKEKINMKNYTVQCQHNLIYSREKNSNKNQKTIQRKINTNGRCVKVPC